MPRLHALDVLEEGARAVLGKEYDELGGALLVRGERDLRQGVQPLRHAGEGEGVAGAMIVERTLPERVTGEDQSALTRIPHGESEFADQPLDTCFAPALVGGQ